MFSYNRGDVHKVSDPSIPYSVQAALQASLDRTMRPNYQRLLGSGPDLDALLDPADSYPFYEYSDFGLKDRALILGCRVAVAIERMPEGYLTHDAQNELIRALDEIARVESENGWAATVQAAAALEEAVKASVKPTVASPLPARPGHLMAEGRAYSIAKEAIKENKHYPRRVSFDEPVNRYTMLTGDRLAVGGDMLTAVTISDTEEHEIKGFGRGVIKTVYTARAVSI